MKHKTLFCLFAIVIFINPRVFAEDFQSTPNSSTFCDFLETFEYEILDYSTPESLKTDAQTPQVVEEYGVFYNLVQMPAGYDIPTELKTFTIENSIDGVVIVPGYESEPDRVIAELMQTVEQKIVLVVSDNATRYPGVIVKKLMNVTETQEAQSRELRSLVKVNRDEKGWRAGFAKNIKRGIERLTGGDTGTDINLNKMWIKETGTFDEMFGMEKMTLTVKGQGPFEIEIEKVENAIFSVNNITAPLVLKILFKNAGARYADDLYISKDGGMYSCRNGE